jgi:hypothetical protein
MCSPTRLEVYALFVKPYNQQKRGRAPRGLEKPKRNPALLMTVAHHSSKSHTVPTHRGTVQITYCMLLISEDLQNFPFPFTILTGTSLRTGLGFCMRGVNLRQPAIKGGAWVATPPQSRGPKSVPLLAMTRSQSPPKGIIPDHPAARLCFKAPKQKGPGVL